MPRENFIAVGQTWIQDGPVLGGYRATTGNRFGLRKRSTFGTGKRSFGTSTPSIITRTRFCGGLSTLPVWPLRTPSIVSTTISVESGCSVQLGSFSELHDLWMLRKWDDVTNLFFTPAAIRIGRRRHAAQRILVAVVGLVVCYEMSRFALLDVIRRIQF